MKAYNFKKYDREVFSGVSSEDLWCRCDEILANMGDRMAAIREEKGVPRSVLAQKLDISEAAVRNLEIGKTRGNMRTVILIALALGVSLDELVGFSEV